MTEFFNKISYWKMAFFRACLYACIVFVIDFLTDTETWSQQTWDDTGPFLIWRLFLGAGVESAMTLVAFLDSTMANLRKGNEPTK